MKKLLNRIFPVLVIALLLTLGVTAYAAEEETQKLTIVHTNDTHGRVDIYGYGKGLVDQVTAGGGEAVFIDNGDVVRGTSFGMNNDGVNVIDVMNLAGVKMMNLGNHEQFLSTTKFAELSELANFPFTGANINNTFREAGKVKDYWIYDFKGTKIAFIGLTTGTNTDRNGADAVACANAAKEAAEAEGATVFIGAFHLGITDTDLTLRSTYIAENCPWLSIIIDGHCHTPYKELVNGVYMVETGEYGNNLGRIDISFKDGAIVGIASENIAIKDNEANCGITPDEDVEEYIAQVREELAYLEETVFTLPVDLDGERTTVRAKECVFGNLVTDAMLTVSDADMAVLPGVFLRTSVPAGDVSMATFQTMFLGKVTPIYEIRVTGQDLWNFMEAALTGVPDVSGNFRHIGGATIRYDEQKEAGSRIVSFTIGGKAIEMGKTYTVAGMSMDMNGIFGEGWEENDAIQKGTHYTLTETDMNTAFAAYLNSGKAVWKTDGRLASIHDLGNVETEEPETDEPETKEPETPADNTEKAPKKGTAFTAGKYGYKITNAKTNGSGTVTVTGVAKGKTVKKVNIPAKVSYKGYTYKVTAVAQKAFYKNKNVTSATIGNEVVTIGKGAFRECKNLKTVTIGGKVQKISDYAFYKCSKLTKVTIGKNVTTIGKYAFASDKKLKTVVIKSKKLTSVGKNSFSTTKKVTITVPAKKYKAYKKLFAKQNNKNIKVKK